MTEKLYYTDAYTSEFIATVLSCEAEGEGYAVTLDRTAFFPEEGGQYADRGYIGGARVEGAREADGVIYHLTAEPVEVGVALPCKIDFDERYEKMQCHTAEHILSGLIHRHFGLDNVGFHLGDDYVTMDISGVLTRAELDMIENEANEAVYKNATVVAAFPTAEELSSLDYRAKLDITENVRIVNIEGYGSCACCAPHVARTGECGLIKILDFQKLRGGIRMFITAGRRALLGYRALFSASSEISKLLSVPKDEVVSGVEKLLSDLEAERAAFKSYRIALIKERAAALATCDGNAVVCIDGLSPEELRIYATEAYSRVGGMLVALTGADGDYKYVIASQSVDLKSIIKDINIALSGRGGGSSSMAQGSFAASIAAIEGYFAAK